MLAKSVSIPRVTFQRTIKLISDVKNVPIKDAISVKFFIATNKLIFNNVDVEFIACICQLIFLFLCASAQVQT